ncbi:unnamed protein product [Heterosigma akashiwo]
MMWCAFSAVLLVIFLWFNTVHSSPSNRNSAGRPIIKARLPGIPDVSWVEAGKEFTLALTSACRGFQEKVNHQVKQLPRPNFDAFLGGGKNSVFASTGIASNQGELATGKNEDIRPNYQPDVSLTAEEKAMLDAQNQRDVDRLLSEVTDDEGWGLVVERQGIKVWKKFLSPGRHSSLRDGESSSITAYDEQEQAALAAMEERAAKFAAVKAAGTINAPASSIYRLFLDNSRVHEYNSLCHKVKDLAYLSEDTKVTWACSPRFGPVKARDFCTVVHCRRLRDGTCVVVNRPAFHRGALRSDPQYIRSELLIAGHVMRPNRKDPENKTDFYVMTHVNLGGICETPPVAALINRLCASSPISLMKNLEKAASHQPQLLL